MKAALIERLFERFAGELPDDDQDEQFSTSRGFALSHVPPFISWLRRNDQLSKGVRVIVALEVTRACGCVELLRDERANVKEAEKKAATECYQCQLKNRREARRA